MGKPGNLVRRTGLGVAALIVWLAAAPAQAGACTAASPYADAVLGSSGLVGYWRLGDASGTDACDHAGSGTGAYLGGVSPAGPGAVAGDDDGAADFDGTSGTVWVSPVGAPSPPSELTLEAWVRPRVASGSHTILRKDGQYLLRISDRRLVFRLWAPDRSMLELTSPVVAVAGEWQHVAAVYDGEAMRLYRNGARVASRGRSGSVRTASDPLYLASSLGYDVFRGTLDEVAIYGAALSPAALVGHVTLAGGSTPPAPVDPGPAQVGGATVGCGLGTFRAGHWPEACWRPYADSSPFNRPLPAEPAVVADSDRIVRRILGMGPIADLVVAPDTSSDWYHPTYYNSPSDPLYTVHCVKHACEGEGLEVRIPAQARPAAGGDGHMTVVDQASGWEWDFWQVQDRPAGPGALAVSAAGRTQITGDGLGSDASAGQWGLLGGIIRAPELQAGQIDHALFMMVGCTRTGHVYPALGDAGHCGDESDAPANGQLLQLDMSDPEIDALAVPAWKKTILRALAHYGAYIGDTGGNEAFGLQLESGSTYTSFGVPDPMATFAAQQSAGVSNWNGKWYFDLASGVDWAQRLRVLDPCVARATC
jgi:hypothetical protein